jgi:TrmH family RNA methyltransferase
MITSTHNERFRQALALRESRDRRRTGRFLVDGRREIGRALDAGVPVVEAWVDPAREEAGELADRIAASGGSLVEASPRLVGLLAYGDRDHGIVAVGEGRPRRPEELALPDAPLLCVLDGLEKPGNVGAILRSADGAGVTGLLLTDPRVDLYNPNTIRASTGTVFTMPVVAASAGEVAGWLREHGVRIVAARLDASLPHTEADLRGAVAVVLGSEAQGLSDAWDGHADVAVRVPMLGVADSLNVSTSAAVLLYEALRQRTG